VAILAVVSGLIFTVDHEPFLHAATQSQVKTYYDWFGFLLDWVRVVEKPAVDLMLDHCQVEDGMTVFELGFGTGRLARELLMKYPNLKYIGTDVSIKMYETAQNRLKEFGDRAELHLTDDSTAVMQRLPGLSVDRFISTYVFDALTTTDLREVIIQTNPRVRDHGKICLTSLSNRVTYDNQHPINYVAYAFIKVWQAVCRACPICLGGCRPLNLKYHFDRTTHAYVITFHQVLVSFGVPTEIFVGTKEH